MAGNYDKRIRVGLKYLSRMNATALRAARLLARLIGNNEISRIQLKAFKFAVEKTPYSAELTEEQFRLLKTKTKTKEVFADAVAALIIQAANSIHAAEDNLCTGLEPDIMQKVRRNSRARASQVRPLYQLGTCVYDDGKITCTNEYVCVVGLLGNWDNDDC